MCLTFRMSILIIWRNCELGVSLSKFYYDSRNSAYDLADFLITRANPVGSLAGETTADLSEDSRADHA